MAVGLQQETVCSIAVYFVLIVWSVDVVSVKRI